MTLLYLSETKKTSELEQQLAELNKMERKHEIDKSIYDQTKEIAFDQLRISTEQTEEANRQKERAEIEKQNALAAQRQANEERIEAENQRNEADKQRAEADKQRAEAENQKNNAERNRLKADTLRYIALARSLGSQSSQIRSSDPEKADLLAYVSYDLTNIYKQREPDLYNSAVFNALTEGSHTKQTWTEHKGATMAISFLEDKDDKEDRFVTASTYGEIKRHTFPEATKVLTTEDIYSNSQYDFRDVYVNHQGVIFALSYTGHLVVKKDGWNAAKIFLLPGIQNPFAISKINSSDSVLILIGKQSIGYFDMQGFMLKGVTPLNFNIVSVGMKNHCPLLFDDRGRMHSIEGVNKIAAPVKVPNGIRGQVTAYANSTKSSLEAYGTKEGIIFVYDVKKGSLLPQLTGHESKITRLRMNNRRLYSSSLDGKLNLWIINDNEREKIEPLTLIKINEWMMNFNFDRTKDRVWTGGQNGTITKSLISIDRMKNKLLNEILKRDLTVEEWNYYIGTDVPWKSFLKERGKEGRK